MIKMQIAKDRSFYLVEIIMNHIKIISLKRRRFNLTLQLKTILINHTQQETVKILVNKHRLIQKRMRMIGQAKKRILRKIKKAKKQRKEIMKIKTLLMIRLEELLLMEVIHKQKYKCKLKCINLILIFFKMILETYNRKLPKFQEVNL